MLLQHESNDENQNNLDYHPLIDDSDITNSYDVDDSVDEKFRNNEDNMSNEDNIHVAKVSVDDQFDEMTLPSNS